ncbi:MAG: ATP-binding cassette domain-containing protein [Candidatus Omnitrophica bacterium]|nr:ATP-binding cassette domain-containing protein [Candidatus Omnitrophota bacterium]
MTSFLLLIPQFQTPLTRFADLNVVVQNSLAAMERIFEIFDVVPDIVDRPGAGDIQSVRGRIEFRDVRFEYSPGSPILKDVNLIIEPHSTVALVGPSGAGKSSLVSLIPRFFDISQGQIFLDGNDIRDIRVKSLRDQIGLIPQEVILFSGTIEENILYGNPSATQEQVRQAAQAANAHDFIIALPDGYETLVGEKGTGLSGGQKQRIAIARAFLKDPPILILDEATSALDSESENAISKALSQLLIGRTTLIIAHRLSTVMNADRIIVLEEGHIREIGTHGSLLEQDGLYRRLCEEQFKVLFAFDRHSESSAQIA